MSHELSGVPGGVCESDQGLKTGWIVFLCQVAKDEAIDLLAEGVLIIDGK